MDFADTTDQAAFRSRVRRLIEEELPPRYRELARSGRPETAFLWEEDRASSDAAKREASAGWAESVRSRGWFAPAWPAEYGGGGLGLLEQFILKQEMAAADAPPPGSNVGIDMLGPVLMIHGTEELRRTHLPRILDASVVWAQGYSEPGAGSDLASLRTRAVRDGDDYVINGQKIWTTHAHQADWIFVLTRTDPDQPKHRGISFLLMDIRTPGITVRPLVNMGWQHEFNETFFEDVRVPAEQRVGEENRGWYVAMTLLDHERSNVTGAVAAQRQIRRLVEFTGGEGGTRSRLGRGGEGGALRQQLAQLAIESEVLLTFSLRIISMQARGQVPNYEASVSKIFGEALDKAVARTGTKLFGLYAHLWDPDEPRAPMMARHTQNYCFSVARSIGGGTSEIQRNVIATRGLGLPRG